MGNEVVIKLQIDKGFVATFLRELADEVEYCESYYQLEDFATPNGCVICVGEK